MGTTVTSFIGLKATLIALQIPDICLNAHSPILQTGVHSEMNWIVCFPAVILMDQDRVFCDVMTSGIPSNTELKNLYINVVN